MARPGRYRILRKIADGGMAEIFLASQRGAEGFERPVVLKRILQALVADPQFRNMLIDEAVDVAVEEVEQLLVEVPGCLHGTTSWSREPYRGSGRQQTARRPLSPRMQSRRMRS